MSITYESFIDKCNSSIKLGDEVLFLQCSDRIRNTKVLKGHDYSIQKIRKIKILCEYQDKFAPKGSSLIQMYKSEYDKMSTLRQSKYRFKRVVELEYYITVGRVSYQIFSSEFINLTFTNLQEVMELDLSDVVWKHDVIEYLITRETQIADWINYCYPAVLEISSWPRYLSAWMFDNNIHNFSLYRTKQFAKSLLRLQHAGGINE